MQVWCSPTKCGDLASDCSEHHWHSALVVTPWNHNAVDVPRSLGCTDSGCPHILLYVSRWAETALTGTIQLVMICGIIKFIFRLMACLKADSLLEISPWLHLRHLVCDAHSLFPPAGTAILKIVSTEHVRFATPSDADPTVYLSAALQDDKVFSL